MTEWDEHAGWWQREFTAGADPEYEEQIIPLVETHLADAARVLDVGCGEGQIARRLAAAGADVIGVDATWAQVETATTRGAGRLTHAEPPRQSPPAPRRSTPWSCAWSSSTLIPSSPR